MLHELSILLLCILGGAGFAVAVVDWRLLRWLGKGLKGEISALFGLVASLLLYGGTVHQSGEWRVWHLVVIVLGSVMVMGVARGLRGLVAFDFSEIEKKGGEK